MTVKSFTFNPFQTNCYVCHDEGEAVIRDRREWEAEYLEEPIPAAPS